MLGNTFSNLSSRFAIGPVLAVSLLLALFYTPIVSFLVRGMADSGIVNYERVLTDTYYARVILTTFKIALYITVVDLLIALPFALVMANRGPAYQIVCLFFVLLPFWSSQLIRVYAWTVIFGRTGPLNEMLLTMGLISKPYQFIGSELAVVVAMAHVMLPYMVLPIYIALSRIPADLKHSAHGLGASSFAVLKTIVLPLALGGIVAGSLLVFIISLGTYVAAAILGSGRVHVLATAIEQQITVLGDWSMASALSMVLLVVTFVLYTVVRMAERWGKAAHGREA